MTGLLKEMFIDCDLTVSYLNVHYPAFLSQFP